MDQERFVAWSGDRNPIHLAPSSGRPDPVATPVVHGIHTALWGLDSLFETVPDLGLPSAIRVRFETLVHVGDCLAPVLVQRDARKLRLNLMRGEERVASLHVGLEPGPSTAPLAPAATLAATDVPFRPDFDAMTSFHARVPITAGQRIVAGLFPSAVRGLGRARVAGLACSSVVVGMICPGLHSLFAGFDLATTTVASDDALTIATRTCDERFRRVILAVEGSGWTGILDTLSPLEPKPRAD